MQDGVLYYGGKSNGVNAILSRDWKWTRLRLEDALV